MEILLTVLPIKTNGIEFGNPTHKTISEKSLSYRDSDDFFYSRNVYMPTICQAKTFQM